VVWGLALQALNSSIAVSSGGGFGQTILNTAIGMGVGVLTNGLFSSFGVNPMLNILAGSAASAATTVISSAVSGHGWGSGYNILGAAVLAAATGAAQYGLQRVVALSRSGVIAGQYLRKDPDAGPDWYKLSDQGRAALGPAFAKLGFDVANVDIHISDDSVVAALTGARTFGDDVFINTDTWNRWQSSPDDQLFLLAHEITHSVQWALAGKVDFITRYLPEETTFGEYDQYHEPQSLTTTDTSAINVLDQRYTLDELADTVATHLEPNAWQARTIKPVSAYGY
jgi:hypothetical protein